MFEHYVEQIGKKVMVAIPLASQSGFALWSDIDLAILGIPADRFYVAVAAIIG